MNKRHAVPFLSLAFALVMVSLLLAACFTIQVEQHPTTARPNEIITATLIITSQEELIGPVQVYFGTQLPVDWQLLGVDFQGNITGTAVYSAPMVARMEEDYGRAGYRWWAGSGPIVVNPQLLLTGTVLLTATVGSQPGIYKLAYMTGDNSWGYPGNINTNHTDGVATQFITITAPHGSSLLPITSERYGLPGQVVTHSQLTLTNLGDAADQFYVQVLSASGWPAVVLSGTTPITQTPVLAPLEQVRLSVAVQVPGGTQPGEFDEAIFSAVSADSPTAVSTMILVSGAAAGVVGFVAEMGDISFPAACVAAVDPVAGGYVEQLKVCARDDEEWQAAISPDNRSLYAATADSFDLWIADLQQEPPPIIHYPLLGNDVAFNCGGDRAVIAKSNAPVFETDSHTIMGQLTFSPTISLITLGPGDIGYGANSQVIQVFDMDALTVLHSMEGFTELSDFVLSPDGTDLYTSHMNGSVQVVSTTAHTVTAAIQLATGTVRQRWLWSIAINPDGRTLYVAGEEQIYVVDTATLTTKATIPGTAIDLQISPDGRTLYAARAYRQSIAMIDVVSLTVIRDIQLEARPAELALFPQPNCSPFPVFTPSAPAVMMGEAITFSNETAGPQPIEYFWEFGDGMTAMEVHPTHVYATGGIYSVRLTATNEYGSRTATQVVTVGSQDLYLPLIVKGQPAD